MPRRASGSEDVRKAEMHPRIALGLLAALIDHAARVDPEREIVAAGEAQPDPGARDALAVDFARSRPVALHVAPIDERDASRARAREAGPAAEVGGVELDRRAIAPVVGDLAVGEAAHGVAPAQPELLADDQHVVGDLPVHREARLPVGRKGAVVVERPAPDRVAAVGALEMARHRARARRAEVLAAAVVAAGEVPRDAEREAGLAVLGAPQARVEQGDPMYHDVGDELHRGPARRPYALVLVAAIVDRRGKAVLVVADPV